MKVKKMFLDEQYYYPWKASFDLCGPSTGSFYEKILQTCFFSKNLSSFAKVKNGHWKSNKTARKAWDDLRKRWLNVKTLKRKQMHSGLVRVLRVILLQFLATFPKALT
jgi:hypothetical protein